KPGDTLLPYALAVLLSSFLLFLVQPIIAKQIVPWFGGSASVWSACLSFFQLVLLAGYAYSDVVQKIAARRQSILHAALLIISLVSLPILASADWKPSGDEVPLLRILGLLALTVGLPYFMLSTTGPLIQSWFAREQLSPERAQRAYRLFALSNFGSLLGLVAYPFAIEPFIGIEEQAWIWSSLYMAFVAVVVWVGLRAVRRASGAARSEPIGAPPTRTVHERDSGQGTQETDGDLEKVKGIQPGAAIHPPGWADYALWFSLAGTATLLLLAISSHITQNIASIPFLWVMPLSLYLLTFVLAFEGRGGRGWYDRSTYLLPSMLIAAFMGWGLVAEDGLMGVTEAVPLYLLGLFLVSFFCHGELAGAKPAARYLTRFYFVLALGGAAGGLTVSLLAPSVAPFYWELPFGLMLVGVLGAWVIMREPRPSLLAPIRSLFLASAGASIGIVAFYAYEQYQTAFYNNIVASRNFYGTLRVNESHYRGLDAPVKRLVHGVILHGLQSTDPKLQGKPTTYYSNASGTGLAIQYLQRTKPNEAIRVGVVGLGVGTLAVYGRSGDHYRFYEINDDVIRFAQEEFTYLGQSAAEISFALGDARLQLEREAPQQFDLLVIDAFSSDSIPVHLITAEAFEVYRKHLKPDGAVAFHVTNRFLRLSPVVQQIAHNAGYMTKLLSHDPDDEGTNALLASSDYVVVTRNKAMLEDKAIRAAETEIPNIPGLRLWTDDFNNLLQVLK
ncbi:MAG: hypothetical protein RLY67_933, partial [Pseudomonadota bacterium]